MCRLLVILFAYFSLTVFSVYAGRVIYPNLLNFEYENSPSAFNFAYDNEPPSSSRIARQSRPVIARQQTSTLSNEDYDDIFGGLDPNQNGFNNNNNNNNQQFGNQRPNQQQQSFGNNRPQGQNGQWSNSNSNNRPTNQNQGQSFTGNNFNNRPTNQNQNQVQTSNGSNGNLSETERIACNNRCKEIVTNEYNPVCGTDSETYQNRRFLECAANCGIQTQLSYIGSCVRTTERTA